jgi:Na+-translocating membrane potential-generating system (MpsC)
MLGDRRSLPTIATLRRDADKTMPEDRLHPDDAAAMREPLAGRSGELRQQLSNAIVALFKQYFGRGPTDCRTDLEPTSSSSC